MFTYYVVYKCEYSDEHAFVRVISNEPCMCVSTDNIKLCPDDRLGISAPVVFDDEHKIVPLIREIQYPVNKEMGKIYVCINPKWNLCYVSTDIFFKSQFTSIKL